MNFLDRLLLANQLGLSNSLDGEQQPVEDQSNAPIVVNGRPAQGQQPANPVSFPDAPDVTLTNGPEAPDFGNRNYVEAARAAVANDRKPQSKLHSILDNIGDALMMANGLKPMHYQRRQQEDLENAMAGFTDNPIAAFERANTVDPEFTDKAYDNYQTNQYRQQSVDSLNRSREDQSLNRLNDNIGALQNYAARLIHAADGDPSKMSYAMQIIGQRAQLLGIPMEALGLDSNITPEQQQIYGAGDMTVNQQVQVPFKERSLDIAQQNADAHTTNANRPRVSAQPRAQTDREAFFEIGKIPPEKRTQSQKDFYEKYAHGTRKGLLDSLGVDTPTSTGKSRFRPVK